jgi:hypothetical protein
MLRDGISSPGTSVKSFTLGLIFSPDVYEFDRWL